MSQQHVIPMKTNYTVFAALMGLLILTVLAAYMPLGRFHFATAMAIAVTKALIIMLYFMHVRYSNKLTWVFAGASFIWLGVLICLTLTDFLSRDWLISSGK